MVSISRNFDVIIDKYIRDVKNCTHRNEAWNEPFLPTLRNLRLKFTEIYNLQKESKENNFEVP